jgi:hypothetical protein
VVLYRPGRPDALHRLDDRRRTNLIEGQPGGDESPLHTDEWNPGFAKGRRVAALNHDAVNRRAVADPDRLHLIGRLPFSAHESTKRWTQPPFLNG